MKKKKRTFLEGYKIARRAASQMKRKRGKYYERWKAGMEAYKERK